ncbi:MAG TPA: GNVR domain-containing protein [Candidatus Kapabacteria bacterium]
MTQEPQVSDTQRKDPHIMDYMMLWVKYRKQVVIITLACAILFLAITYVMPFTYSSVAMLMPPEKEKAGGLMSFLSGSGALDLMKGQENPALDQFKNVIDSRAVSETLAKDARLQKYFSVFDTSFDAIAFHIKNSMTSEPLRSGVMTVQVDIKTQWLPSSEQKEEARLLTSYLANRYVQQLDYFNRHRLMTSARLLREFTEGEYNKRMVQLDTAYVNLQNFQEENKAVALTDQLSATVTSAAMLASEVQQLEMQLAVEEREMTASSARASMIRARLEEARMQLRRYDDGSIGEYSIALNKVPTLTRKLAKLMREVKLLETISAFLRQQLEQEKLNEQRNIPTFNLLDTAVTPLRKSSPKRAQVLLLGIIVGIVASGIFISIKKYKLSVQLHPEEHTRYLAFRQALKVRS